MKKSTLILLGVLEMLVEIDTDPMDINGKKYYTIKQFAILTNRTEQSVRFLIYKGNRIRKLQREILFRKIFIPAEELTDYPFTCVGPSTDDPDEGVYHYNELGQIVNEV